MLYLPAFVSLTVNVVDFPNPVVLPLASIPLPSTSRLCVCAPSFTPLNVYVPGFGSVIELGVRVKSFRMTVTLLPETPACSPRAPWFGLPPPPPPHPASSATAAAGTRSNLRMAWEHTPFERGETAWFPREPLPCGR